MSSYQKVRIAERATVLMGQSPPSLTCSESGDGLPFIMLFLNCPSTRRELNILGQGVTRDRVNLTTLLTLRVLRPPVEEQRHIVKMIDALDLRMQTEETLRSKLAFLKSGLMSDLLTGRVRVPEEIAVAP